MFGTGGIAGRRADAAILLADEFLNAQGLVPGIAPELAPHPLMHEFGKGFRQPVGQSLEHDGVVIVVLGFKGRNARVDANAGCHRKGAEVIAHAGTFRRHQIGETLIRLVRRLDHLLTQKMEGRNNLVARLAGINFHIIAGAVGGE